MQSQSEETSSYVTELADRFPPQGQWTEEDYFGLPERKRITELANGELIMPANPTFEHQRAVTRLARKVGDFVDRSALGEVIVAPFAVRLQEDLIRQPDVLFIRTERLGLIKGTMVDGAPDWVAEVISPSTRKTDSLTKLGEYGRAGIPEYWLVDLEEGAVSVYVLHAGERVYRLMGRYTPGQQVVSVTLSGLTVPVEAIISADEAG